MVSSYKLHTVFFVNFIDGTTLLIQNLMSHLGTPKQKGFSEPKFIVTWFKIKKIVGIRKNDFIALKGQLISVKELDVIYIN